MEEVGRLWSGARRAGHSLTSDAFAQKAAYIELRIHIEELLSEFRKFKSKVVRKETAKASWPP